MTRLRIPGNHKKFEAKAREARARINAEYADNVVRLEDLKKRRTALEAELAEIRANQPKPMAPNAVAIACRKAGVPTLALKFIESGIDQASLENHLSRIPAVRNLCQRFGFGRHADSVIAHIDDPVNMLRHAINEQSVLWDEENNIDGCVSVN